MLSDVSGVEHLLRDVKDATVSTLATEVRRMVTGLHGLKSRLREVQEYLELVLAGKLPVNHDIVYELQVTVSGCCHPFVILGLVVAANADNMFQGVWRWQTFDKRTN
jgi:Maintenance of mitochondrial structure and function